MQKRMMEDKPVIIHGDGTSLWTMTHNRDFAKALNKELKAVHVASEFLASISDFDFTGGLLGDKANSVVFDNSKVKRLVPEYVTTVRFDQGIKETISYILSHPELQVEDPEFDQWCDKVIEVIEDAKKAF